MCGLNWWEWRTLSEGGGKDFAHLPNCSSICGRHKTNSMLMKYWGQLSMPLQPAVSECSSIHYIGLNYFYNGGRYKLTSQSSYVS